MRSIVVAITKPCSGSALEQSIESAVVGIKSERMTRRERWKERHIEIFNFSKTYYYKILNCEIFFTIQFSICLRMLYFIITINIFLKKILCLTIISIPFPYFLNISHGNVLVKFHIKIFSTSNNKTIIVHWLKGNHCPWSYNELKFS